MFHGLYCGYTAGLEATGRALGLLEDKRKLNTGKALIRYFCTPCAPSKANGGRTRNLPQHDPAKWELFKEYNRQDVVTEMEIDRRPPTPSLTGCKSNGKRTSSSMPVAWPWTWRWCPGLSTWGTPCARTS